MTFSFALDHLMMGKRVKRKHWKCFLMLDENKTITVSFAHKIIQRWQPNQNDILATDWIISL